MVTMRTLGGRHPRITLVGIQVQVNNYIKGFNQHASALLTTNAHDPHLRPCGPGEWREMGGVCMRVPVCLSISLLMDRRLSLWSENGFSEAPRFPALPSSLMLALTQGWTRAHSACPLVGLAGTDMNLPNFYDWGTFRQEPIKRCDLIITSWVFPCPLLALWLGTGREEINSANSSWSMVRGGTLVRNLPGLSVPSHWGQC